MNVLVIFVDGRVMDTVNATVICYLLLIVKEIA